MLACLCGVHTEHIVSSSIYPSAHPSITNFIGRLDASLIISLDEINYGLETSKHLTTSDGWINDEVPHSMLVTVMIRP
jgi:hypothetical protein